MRRTKILSNAEFDPHYFPSQVQDFGAGMHPALELYGVAVQVNQEVMGRHS